MDQLEPIKVLGEGAFGKVYLMRHRQERTLQCVKVIKIKNIPKKEREACRAEVQLMKRLRHPNIVAYRDSFLARNRESLCIVMTYCDGGDLVNQITQAAKRRRPFTEAKVLHWFVQMALGLHYMHANRVLHRDLKTQNIFLLGNGRLVLGDLGISKVLEGTLDFAQTCIGTPYYMSPEIFKNKPYNHKSDIWALGCSMAQIVTLECAYDDLYTHREIIEELTDKVCKGETIVPINIAMLEEGPFRELCQGCCSMVPSTRSSAQEVSHDLQILLNEQKENHHEEYLFRIF